MALYDFETIRDVFSRDEAQGRMDSFFFRFRTGGLVRGLVTNEGHDWKLHRR